MKGKWLVTLVFVLALSGGTAAMANSGDAVKSSGNSHSTNSLAGMDMSGSQKDNNMSGMDMSGKDKNMDMSGSQKDNNMSGMDMGGGPVKETPANIKILGTYGAVNLSFILIGIWSKWFRRKDGSNGYSK